jgi:cell wall-associated NlpC family hydrolase
LDYATAFLQTIVMPNHRRSLTAAVLRLLRVSMPLGAVVALLATGAATGQTTAKTTKTTKSVKPLTTASPYESSTPYYEVSPTTGAVWPLTGAKYYGQVNAVKQDTTIVGVTVAPGDRGYWEVSANGRVWAFGSAHFEGSPYRSHLTGQTAGLLPTTDGKGYWIYDKNGSVHAYGDAVNHGSLAGRVLLSPVIDMVATANDGGYWLVTAKGRAAAYGNARSYGDLRATKLTTTITGMARMPSGSGYWLLGANGQVWAYGGAHSYGSLPAAQRTQPMQAIVATSNGDGYWMIAHDGDVHTFGDATIGALPEFAFVHSVQTAGDRALEWAMKQLGKPYVWGGTGPKGFDCSGLTMMSWEAAGTDIPRIADDQYIQEKDKIALSSLADGGLVFWSSNTSVPGDIYHVALYLGSGNVVAAPETGENVQTQSIWTDELMGKGVSP